jgi:hypothetical protein
VAGSGHEVHRALGAGLLESACGLCLAHERQFRGLHVRRQDALPLRYDTVTMESGYRLRPRGDQRQLHHALGHDRNPAICDSHNVR